MVAPTWLLMSSPMMGRPSAAKRRCHSGSRPMKTGMALTKPTPAVEGLLGVPARGHLAADRQVGDEHVDLSLAQDAGHVDGRAVRLAR